MRALLFFFCLLVPITVLSAEFTFIGFGNPPDLPNGWKEMFNRTLHDHPNVEYVQFTYFEKKVSGPQSHMVIVSMKIDDGSYRGGSYENFLSSKYELARGALVDTLRRIPSAPKK